MYKSQEYLYSFLHFNFPLEEPQVRSCQWLWGSDTWKEPPKKLWEFTGNSIHSDTARKLAVSSFSQW